MTSIINQRWPLGNLMDGFPNGKKQNKLSFCGVPEKGYFEEFNKDPKYISFSGTPEKAYFEEFNRYRNIDEDDDRDTFPLFNEISSNPESESYLQTFVDNVRINTDINFVSKTNSFSQNDLSYLNATYVDKSLSLELPIKFNWAKTTSADSPDVVAKKKLISKPDNQYLCGSCWAVSVAGVVGDVFCSCRVS